MGKASGIRAGRAFVELGVDDKTSAGLKAVSAKMKRFADSVGAVGMSMLKMGAMMAAPLVAGAKVFSSMGDQIAKMARRTGMSTEALSELSYAASRSGTTVEALENSLRRMQRTIYDAGEGLSTAVDGLANLGLSLGELQGLKPEEQFKLMAQRLSEIEDPTTRAAMAMVLFGRSGTALLPMFEKGAAGIEELQAAARRLGLTISQEDAAAAEKFTDIIADLWKVIKQGLFTVGAALAEQLQTWAKDFTDTAASAKEFVDQHRQLVVVGAQVVKWTFVIGGSLVVLSKLFYAGATAVTAFRIALTFMQAHPVILAFTAIAAAAAIVAGALWSARNSQREFNKAVAQSHQAAQGRIEQSDKQIARLEELAKKEQRNNEEMQEARDLVATLTAAHGRLGIKIDETTGKITGLSKAQEKLNKLRLDEKIYETRAKYRQAELEALQADQDKQLAWTKSGERAAAQRVRDAELRMKIITQEGIILGRMKAEQKGLAPPAPAGAGGPIAAGKGRESAAKAIAAADRRIHQLAIGQIQDEKQRELAATNERYDQEIIATRGLAAEEKWSAKETDRVIRRLENARNIELAATGSKFDKQVQDQMDERAQQRFDSEKDQAARIAELRLRTQYEGVELQEKLLDLERERAIIAAVAAGENLDAVKEEFRLREKLLGVGKGITAGGAWRALGGRAFQTDPSIESLKQSGRETADNTRRIADGMETFMPRFT